MKRFLLCLLMVLLLVTVLASCDDTSEDIADTTSPDGTTCEHTWVDATCTAVKTCSKCQVTEGTALGHDMVTDAAVAATCTETGLAEGSHCSRCDAATTAQTVVPALGHSEGKDGDKAATCTDKAYCSRCESEYGEIDPDAHDMAEATCTEPSTCKNGCGHTVGAALGHSTDKEGDSAATCMTKAYCSVCQSEYGEVDPDAHDMAEATCTEPSICKNGCGLNIGEALGHDMAEATCTEPSTCKNGCGCTEGKALGHNYDDRVCTVCGDVYYSQGLEFTSNGDGTCSVSDIGSCEDEHVYIPPKSPEGDTVTSIGAFAFLRCGNLTSVTIPDGVVSIGDFAFDDCSGLTNIVFSDSVAIIGDHAFSGCSSLTGVVIGNGVTSIGWHAFRGCGSLTSVVLGNSVTSIGDNAFTDCYSLTSIVIPPSVESIGDEAFYGCYKLVEVINHSDLFLRMGIRLNGCVAYYALGIHKGESKIDNQNGYLFYTCNGTNYLFGYVGNDVELTLPENYKGESYVIYQHAFYKCGNLTSITIPECVTSIGDGAFAECGNLERIVIPDSVTSIGTAVFSGCSDSIQIYFMGTEEEWNAIEKADAMIPAGATIHFVECAHEWTDATCTAPKTCSVCGETEGEALGHSWVDADCDTPKTCSVCGETEGEALGHSWVDADCDTPKTCSVCGETEGEALGHTWVDADCDTPKTCSVCGDTEGEALGHDMVTDAAVAPTCTATGLTAGSHCSRCDGATTAQEVVGALGHDMVTDAAVAPTCTATGLTEGSHCSRCDGATTEQKVVDALGHSTEAIGDRAATCTEKAYCSRCESEYGEALGHSYAGQTCTECGYVYYSQGLEFAPNGDGTYSVSGIGTCKDTELYIPPTTPEGAPVTSIGASAFEDCYTPLTNVVVPDSVTSIGDLAFYNCVCIANVTIGNGVETIGASAFEGCVALTSVMIPDNVTSIGDKAFESCGLVNATIGNGVTSIGASAFEFCNYLTSITLGNSVATIGERAFRFCIVLTEIEIPDSVMSIEVSAFEYCRILENVSMGNGVKSIGASAFHQCNALKNITIPDSVTSIGESAFKHCSALEYVTIGNGVTSIGEGAFNGCSGLTIVTIGNRVTNIDAYAFLGCDSLTDVYFMGTETEWNAIEKSLAYIPVEATIHFVECAHEWTDATCTAPKTCSKCGDTEGEALGHSYGAWVTTKNPTDDDEGEKQKVCGSCGDTVVESIPPKFIGGDIIIVG